MKEPKKLSGSCETAQMGEQAGGKKDDGGKPRLDLIPPEAIQALGDVLTFGAGKYGDRNWEKGLQNGRLYAAVQRHLNAYWGGEDLDFESGMPHLWHALTGLAMLTTLTERGKCDDTRFS